MANILLVEDDKLLGKSLSATLQDAGYEVYWAEKGEDVFEAVKAQKMDLVFLDIMLPGIDGYEILKRLKEDDATKAIPVIMLSNLGQMKEIERAMELGAKDYLIKANIDLDELVKLTKTKYL